MQDCNAMHPCIHSRILDSDRRFSYSNLAIFSPPDALAAPALLRRVFPPSLDIVALEEALDGVVFLCEYLAGRDAVDDRVAWSASSGVRVQEGGRLHMF